MSDQTVSETIDTSDAAPVDRPKKRLSGLQKTVIALGPFLILWFTWWRLGSQKISRTGKYEGESAALEWLYRTPRTWTVDWFNFAGRDGFASVSYKASGWVNTWFDHLRYEELLQFTVAWHLPKGPWLAILAVGLIATGWMAWRTQSARWTAGAVFLALLGWSADLLDFLQISPTPWIYVFLTIAVATTVRSLQTQKFKWIAATASIGTIGWVALQTKEESFNVKSFFRLVAGWLEFPLDVTEGLLISGYGPWHLPNMPWIFIFALLISGGGWLAWQRRSTAWAISTLLLGWAAAVSLYEPWHIPSLPWVVIAGLFGVVGWKLGGWRLSLLSTGFILYAAFVGEPAEQVGAETRWDKTMITLSAVLVAVPIAAFLGGLIGLVAAKRRRVEQFLIPIMNLTQAFPHFTFLIPIGVFIGISHKAGVIATIAYAIPPMARVTILGIQGISNEVIEAGIMGGCTRRQMIWKVELPAARQSLLVGVNQVVMECLAMVVIASFVGTAGLGQDLLFRLTGLHIGAGVEIGIAIVVMAITLDRLSQALGHLQPSHHAIDVPFWKRHPFLLASGAVVLGGLVTAQIWDAAHRVPNSWMWGHEAFWEWLVDKGKTDVAWWSLSGERWLIPLLGVMGLTGWRTWSSRSYRWLIATVLLTLSGWSVGLFDFLHLSGKPWIYVFIACGLTAAVYGCVALDKLKTTGNDVGNTARPANSEILQSLQFKLATVVATIAALGWVTLRANEESFTVNIRDYTISFRDALESWILLPMRDAYLTIPWVGLAMLFGVVGYLINGRRPALMAAGMIAFISLTGFWWQAMWNLYQLTFAVVLAVIFGVPFGIWAATRKRRNATVQVLLDFFQTFPSFVYLFPAIMFFDVSETAIIVAIVLSASVPAIRYTIFGIQNVPEPLVEASTMAGCTPRQTLWKVKLPMAVPEIMLGINQTIMFGLFMVMIAGLIKTTGLARELIEAQPNIDSGRAIVAGIAVACIGMASDVLISEWADKRKRQLGLIS
jgi:ABC-type proline/glycine betaine transport system permease subunit